MKRAHDRRDRELTVNRLSRRAFMRLSAATVLGAAAGALAGGVASRADALPGGSRIRVGVVVPGTSGYRVIDAALYDIVADAARVGSILVDSDVARLAQQADHRYRMLTAHAPTASAAARAAQRLIELEQVDVLVGGIGAGHASALSEVAREAGIVFMNVGDGDDRLRAEAGQHLFHVEPSNAMYLDALADWHTRLGRRRFFVIDDVAHSGGILARVRSAVERHGRGAAVVGHAEVRAGQPLYFDELAAVSENESDVVIAAVDIRDEIFLRYGVADLGRGVAFAGLPNAVTQTRDFIAASRVRGEDLPVDHRIMAWETTLASDAAADLNVRVTSRAGQPAEPSAWATYQAVRSYYEAAVDAGSTAAADVAARLVDAERGLVSPKGDGLSFRPWDHQLRQPLYVSEVDPAARWDATLTRRIEIARVAAILPDGDGGSLTERLDAYGDVPR